MQLVDWVHEGEVRRQHWARQVVHRAARNADGLGLLGNAQRVVTVDHRLAFSNPALLSAPSKKSGSSGNSVGGFQALTERKAASLQGFDRVSRARNRTVFSDGGSGEAEATVVGRIRVSGLSTGGDGTRYLW